MMTLFSSPPRVRRCGPSLCLLLFALTLRLSAAQPTCEPGYFKTGVLTLQDRIWAQTQIERVYYNHRLWPKENPGSNPPFESLAPAALIETKAAEPLRMTAALRKFWNVEITPAMLQTEMDRTERNSKDRATLHELFVALHNDPYLIAEILARGNLAEKAIRNHYAWDARFHADASSRAEAAASDLAPLAGLHAGACSHNCAGEGRWKTLGAEYQRHTFILDDRDEQQSEMAALEPGASRVKAEEFESLKKKHADLLTSPSSGGEGSISRNGRSEESPDQFFIERTLSITDARIEVETLVFPKRSLMTGGRKRRRKRLPRRCLPPPNGTPFTCLRRASSLQADAMFGMAGTN